MTPDEIDNALADLSTRMERVRALYEQYFMGIERTEPHIPRKDLDRRIEFLRKTPFQNTARRFKFQTLIQRYTSLQQYWHRTCRDIENGTYRKHLQKAKRKFDEEQPTRGFDGEDAVRERAEHAASAKQRAEDELAAMLDADMDMEAEMRSALGAFQPEPSTSPTAGSGKELKKSGGLLGSLGKRAESEAQTGSAQGDRKTSPRLSLDALPKTPGAEDRPSLLGGRNTQTSPRPTAAGLPPLKPPAERTAAAATTAAGPSRPLPPPRVSAAPVAPSQRAAAAQAGAAAHAPSTGDRPASPPARPATAPVRPHPPAGVPNAASPTASPAAPATPPPRPATGTAPVRPAPAPAARPAAPTPAARPAAPAASAARAPTAAQLSEDRLRAIHASYQAAREKTNAASVSYEKLAKSIRDTEQQLRAKHQGRKIDFDVSIKDGKAIIKPKLG